MKIVLAAILAVFVSLSVSARGHVSNYSQTLAAGPVSEAVPVRALQFKHNQRALNDEENVSFSGVGSFYCRANDGSWKHFGTGFLTDRSDRHVVTSEHIFSLVDPSDDMCNGERALSAVRFFSQSCGEFFEIVERQGMTPNVMKHRGKDIAVVKLAKPMCPAAKGLGMRMVTDKDMSVLAKGGAGVVSTYPGADYLSPIRLRSLKEFTQSLAPAKVEATGTYVGYGRLGKIHDLNDDEYLVEHSVTTNYGASGGPMVARWMGTYSAFGIHTGFEKEDSEYNWGIAFSEGTIGWIAEQMRR